MNKKLGKVAAIALSAAMISSAFAMSTSSSFAATTVTPVVTSVATKDVAASTNAALAAVGTQGLNLDSITSDVTVKEGNTSETVSASFGKLSTDSAGYKLTTSDASVVEVADSNTITAGTATTTKLTVKKEGTATITATFANEKVNGASAATALVSKETKHAVKETVTQNVTVTYKIHAYSTGAVIVVPNGYTNGAADVGPLPTDGTYVSGQNTLPFNQTKKFVAAKVTATTATDKDGLAKYTAASQTEVATFAVTGSDAASFTATADTIGSAANGESLVLASSTSAPSSNKTATVSVASGTVYQNVLNKIYPATVTTSNTYELATTSVTAGSASAWGDGATTDGTTTITGLNVNVPTGDTLTVNPGAKLGNITGAGDVVLAGGTVSSINITGKVTTKADAAAVKVGDITATKVDLGTNNDSAAADFDGDIAVGKITAATVNVIGDATPNSDSAYSSITTADVSTTDLNVTASQGPTKVAQGTVKLGNVTATGAVTVTAPADTKNLTVGTITGGLGLDAEQCGYAASFTLAAGSFTTGDLKYIGNVTLAANTTLTAGAINTGKKVSDANCGTPNATAKVELGDGSTLKASSIYAADITEASGITAAKIVVPANSLTIAGTAAALSNTTLEVTGMKTGSVLYTTVDGKAAQFASVLGVSAIDKKASATTSNAYDYVAKTVKFTGIQMDPATASIGQNASATLTAKSIADVDLPTGVTVKWSANRASVKLAPSADTKSCVVTSTGYTADNLNDSNNVTVSATLVKDGIDYTDVSAYNVTSTVTLTAEVAPVLTTTVTGLDGKTQTVTSDSVIKIPQSTDYRVNFSSDKAIAPFAYTTGNDKVAQTGTATPWNGTAGTYTIYTNGAVGSQAGVFVNGKKVFIVEITARPFKSDTTVDLDGAKALKAGQKYSFKIYDLQKGQTFKTFSTGSDASLSTSGFKVQADGSVIATVTAVKAGRYGVFITLNDGTKDVQYKVFAATVK